MTAAAQRARVQYRVVWTALLVLVLMLVLPPWMYTFHVGSGGDRLDAEWPAGYAPIFAPPPVQGPPTGVRLDFSRLLLQVVAVGLITAALWWRLGRVPRIVAPSATPQPSGTDELEHAYRSLGVERTISPDALRETYRDLVRVWHPDRFRDDPELQQKAAAKLREINRAFERIQASGAPSPLRSTGLGPDSDPVVSSRRTAPVVQSRWGQPVAIGAVLMVAIGLIVWIVAQVPPQSSQSIPPVAPVPRPYASAEKGPPWSIEDLLGGPGKTPSTPAPEASPQMRPSIGPDGKPQRQPPGQSILDRMSDEQLLGRGVESPPAPAPPFRSGPSINREATPPRMRPPNGTRVRNRGPQGLGTLTIDNGSGQDAVITLVDEGRADERTRWAIYVWAKHRVTLTDVGPGTYRLQFSLGTVWNPAAEHFREDPSFLEFVDPLRLTEEQTDDGVRYQTYQITLHTVPGGTARTKRINERDFRLD